MTSEAQAYHVNGYDHNGMPAFRLSHPASGRKHAKPLRPSRSPAQTVDVTEDCTELEETFPSQRGWLARTKVNRQTTPNDARTACETFSVRL